MRRILTLNSAGFFLGIVIFTAGLYWVYPPAAFIGAGLILMFVSLFGRETK